MGHKIDVTKQEIPLPSYIRTILGLKRKKKQPEPREKNHIFPFKPSCI